MAEAFPSQKETGTNEPQKFTLLLKLIKYYRVAILILTLLTIIFIVGLTLVLKLVRNQRNQGIVPTVSPINTPVLVKGQLAKDIENFNSVMWIGAHADDEMFVAGTLGYLCKDKNYQCTIVAFGASPKLKKTNSQSAVYLNQADYIRIPERLEGKGISCPEKDYDCFVSQWQAKGYQDELKKIIQEKGPAIVLTFGPSSEYGVKDVHAASAYIAQEAIRLTGGQGNHYYVINTMHLLTKDSAPEIQKATDIIELNSQLWSYRMKVISFYAPFYSPNDLTKMVNDQAYQNTLLHQELFKRAAIGQLVCPESNRIDCMPMVNPGSGRVWLCSKEYLDWAKDNCPGLEIAY